MTHIVKATSKGQITLPAKWRREMATDRFVVRKHGDTIRISPLRIASEPERREYTVFDAIRDNKGKGIRARDLVRILKSMS